MRKGEDCKLEHGDELALILGRSRHSALGVRRCAFVFHDLSLPRGELFVRAMQKHQVTRRYRFLRHLGRGAFGVVWHAQDTLAAGRDVAMKAVDRRKHQLGGGSRPSRFVPTSYVYVRP